MSNSKTIDDVTYLVQKVENIDVNVLKDIIDKLTANLNKTVVFFADVVGDKIIFIAKQKNTSFVCGNLVKEAAIIAGGNGGGRPDFAQAGGKDVSKVDDALAKINNISILPKQSYIPLELQNIFERQIKYGVQYPIFTNESQEIIVKMTDRGKDLFKRIYLY